MHQSFRDGFEKVALGQKAIRRAHDAVGARIGKALHSGKPMDDSAKASLYARVNKVKTHVENTAAKAQAPGVAPKVEAPSATPKVEAPSDLTQTAAKTKRVTNRKRGSNKPQATEQPPTQQQQNTKGFGWKSLAGTAAGGTAIGAVGHSMAQQPQQPQPQNQAAYQYY